MHLKSDFKFKKLCVRVMVYLDIINYVTGDKLLKKFM
jgi:hypothetical protein